MLSFGFTRWARLAARPAGIFLLWALSHGGVVAGQASNATVPLLVLGWVEHIRIEPWGVKARARLDTGANTASISAHDIELFRKNGKQWVKFMFDFSSAGKERSIQIERPVIRIGKIKRHDGPLQERPVINMDICLANEVRTIEFNLIDRRVLNYPVLLGRKALAGRALIDSSRTSLSKADCGHKKKKKKKTNGNGLSDAGTIK
ncbi:MAG: ATP-dependent zinc protease [Nitrosomonas sp.]|nr:ATP-dependent zinc protease [Nitrosomonas sp.]